MATEKRLIDAKALWNYVKTTPISASTRVTIMCLLDTAPTVDAVEVVRGRWDIDEFGVFCTACKEYAEDDRRTTYCPECGAKMDLEG